MRAIVSRPELSGKGRSRALATVCTILFLTFVDNTIVSVVLGHVQRDLAAGVTGLQWVVNGYMLTFAALMLTFGTLGDLFGRKKIMLTGVAVFCAGSAVCMLAPNLKVLIVGRVVMGVGAAASEPGTLSMIRHVYPERETRAKALGVWAAVSGMALALGPVIGGVIVGVSGWREVFAFGLVLGAVALLVGLMALPENSNPEGRKVDVPGLLLGGCALAAATVATIEGETHGYRTWWIAGLYVLAVIGVLASVVGAYYYLRIVKVMYFDEPAEAFEPMPGLLKVVLGVSGVFMLFFFVYPSPLVSAAAAAAKSLF